MKSQKVRFGRKLSEVRIPNRQRRQAVGHLTITNCAGLVSLALSVGPKSGNFSTFSYHVCLTPLEVRSVFERCNSDSDVVRNISDT